MTNKSTATLPRGEPRRTAWPADLSARLAGQMAEMTAVDRRTKRTAARLAIVSLIRDGTLPPGAPLPPEKELAVMLGVSLGTIQAALRQLQDQGTIVRRRRGGSRVASGEPLPSSVWHFRFLAKADGRPLRVTDQKVWVEFVTEQGDWSAYLGPYPRYVRIRRRIVLTDGTPVGAEMYLDAALAPGLDRIDPRELTMISIRPYLEERYGIATAGATHVTRTTTLDKKTALAFGLSAQGTYFEVHAKSYDRAQKPVYFQRIFASAESCALSF